MARLGAVEQAWGAGSREKRSEVFFPQTTRPPTTLSTALPT